MKEYRTNTTEMSDGEYKTLRGEYDKKALEAADRVKKALTAFLVAFAASFALLHIVGLLNSDADYGNGIGNYTWLAAEFLLALFFYGLKDEDSPKKIYETDKRILLGYVKNKITSYKIRLWLIVVLGAVFAVLNIICWWFALQYIAMPSGGSDSILGSLLRDFFNTKTIPFCERHQRNMKPRCDLRNKN